MPRYWEAKGQAEWVKTIYGVVLAVELLAVLAAAGGLALARRRPVYAARTDLQGRTDLVRVSPDTTASAIEAQAFLEDLVLRADDLDYVTPRIAPHVRWIVGGLATPASEDDEQTGRIDVEIETTRVLSEQPPFQIEVQMAIEFSGRYLPPGLGIRDPRNPRQEHYGFVFTISVEPRTTENWHGLRVSAISRVAIEDAAQ